jgi:hypothetical protein
MGESLGLPRKGFVTRRLLIHTLERYAVARRWRFESRYQMSAFCTGTVPYSTCALEILRLRSTPEACFSPCHTMSHPRMVLV